MNSDDRWFTVEQSGHTFVVTLFESPSHEPTALEDAVMFSDSGHVTNVVVDLHKIDWCDSRVLNALVILYKRSRSTGGMMAVCNLSQSMEEILWSGMPKQLWAVCKSRADAIAEVEKAGQ